jgi:hypothetical protein
MRKPVSIACTLLAVLGVCVGCGGISRQQATRAIDQIAAQKVHLVYTVDYLEAHRPFKLLDKSGGQRVLTRHEPTESMPDWRLDTVVGVLTIDYPSTGSGTAGTAVWQMNVRGEQWQTELAPKSLWTGLMEFVLLPFKGITGLDYKSRFEHHERFRLVISAAEVASVIEGMMVGGYFDQAFREDQGVYLDLRMNDLREKKYWQAVADIESLIDRTRLKGDELAYRRASDSPLTRLAPKAKPDTER